MLWVRELGSSFPPPRQTESDQASAQEAEGGWFRNNAVRIKVICRTGSDKAQADGCIDPHNTSHSHAWAMRVADTDRLLTGLVGRTKGPPIESSKGFHLPSLTYSLEGSRISHQHLDRSANSCSFGKLDARMYGSNGAFATGACRPEVDER